MFFKVDALKNMQMSQENTCVVESLGRPEDLQIH